MATANEVQDNGLREQAVEYTLAANPLVGIREQEIFESAGKLFEQTLINPRSPQYIICPISASSGASQPAARSSRPTPRTSASPIPHGRTAPPIA